ncbi:MAG: hypothetical protein CME69_07140 [Halobacteriovorax sp.]|nr:hypothetical protein [Halobacteriovorax sp.]MEE3077801.1 phospholipase A2 [Bdellovibrionota bacterium]
MKKLSLFTLFFLVTMQNAFANDLLNTYCKELGGEVRKTYQCPKSRLKLSFGFCVFENDQGIEQFFDGCTGPDGGHTALFYPHCIKHDLCYHHEPISNGLKQKDCDQEFRDGLLRSCRQAKSEKKCRAWAKTMYRAVRMFGVLAFNCANYEASY